MTAPAPPRIFDAADDEITAYRGLSSLAVIGLLVALLAPLAMFAAYLLVLPLLAAVLSGLALWRIAAQAPNLAGRKAALAGMLLGVTFLVAAPADELLYRYFIRREARQFADDWIDAVRYGQVYIAHNLTLDPQRRVPPTAPPDMTLAEHYAAYYRDHNVFKRLLPAFLDKPLMRTLFALGTAAEYRPYDTAEEGSRGEGDYVALTYAVTFRDENQQKKTFFITLEMGRLIQHKTGRCDWIMGRVEGPVKPAGW